MNASCGCSWTVVSERWDSVVVHSLSTSSSWCSCRYRWRSYPCLRVICWSHRAVGSQRWRPLAAYGTRCSRWRHYCLGVDSRTACSRHFWGRQQREGEIGYVVVWLIGSDDSGCSNGFSIRPLPLLVSSNTDRDIMPLRTLFVITGRMESSS